ncbi:uncharacterized protein ACJ7VT_000283 [Polymixia lowei]
MANSASLTLWFQRNEIQRMLSEKLKRDSYLERIIDICQAQERSLRQQKAQDEKRLSLDISELQSKLEAFRISEGKVREKTGGVGTPEINAMGYDSDKAQSGTQAKGQTPKRMSVCSRRK